MKNILFIIIASFTISLNAQSGKDEKQKKPVPAIVLRENSRELSPVYRNNRHETIQQRRQQAVQNQVRLEHQRLNVTQNRKKILEQRRKFIQSKASNYQQLQRKRQQIIRQRMIQQKRNSR